MGKEIDKKAEKSLIIKTEYVLDSMKSEFDSYFLSCAEKNDMADIKGFCVCNGYGFSEFCTFIKDSTDVEWGRFFNYMSDKCEVEAVNNMIKGRGAPVGHIFTLKNKYGWKDNPNTAIQININFHDKDEGVL